MHIPCCAKPYHTLPYFHTVLTFIVIPCCSKPYHRYNHYHYIPYHTELLHLNPFPNRPWLLRGCLQLTSFENTAGKGEIARNEQFSFSRSVFYPSGELFAIFIQFEIVVCKLFQLRRV